MLKHKDRLVSLLISAMFFIIGLITLPHYGVDWDTINHLTRGQAYFSYFLTGETSFNKLPEFKKYYQKENTIFFSPNQSKELIPRRSFYQVSGYDANYYLSNDKGHPPLSDILSSAFNFILFQRLGIINDIDSYHVYLILAASMLIGSVYWFMQKQYGSFAAIVSVLSLALYPLFLGESHFNLKDIPETVFYSLAILSYFLAIVGRKKKWIIISAIFFGLGLGTKFNILFMPVILFSWTAVFLFHSRRSIVQYLKFSPILLVFPIISSVIFVASWPFLWQSPIDRIIQTLSFYKGLGISSSFNPEYIYFGFNTYAIQWILYTTPLVTLFFTFFGIVYTFTKGRKEKDKKALLFFLWLLIPIARVTIPNAGIYGGVRQLMEFIPAMAILSGIGASYIVKLLYGYIVKQFSNKAIRQFIKPIFMSILILSFIPITLKLISIHPNENVYFNPLIGGLKGAKEKDMPYWGNSFGNVYRQAIHWINTNVPKNSTLALSQELMPNLPSLLVRNDLIYNSAKRSGYFKDGEYVIGLDYGSPFSQIYYSSRYYTRTLEPIYRIQVDGTSILNIWKNDINHTRKDHLGEMELTNISYKITDDGILFDLKQKVFLNRIYWQFSEKNCKKITLGYFRVSSDGDNWIYTPHNLPDEAPIPIAKTQPDGNSLLYPFGSEYARYIFFHAEPKNSCVKQILNTRVHYYPDASTSN